MMRFFSKISPRTVQDAKNRLKSVIINDRMNVSEDMTIENIRKEVSAVLCKYVPNSEHPPQVSVRCSQEEICFVSATVPIKHFGLKRRETT